MRGTGLPENIWSAAMGEPAVIRLPPLTGGQAESWRARIEIAPQLGHHWLLIGGQMVFLHEVERESTDVRPTNDIDLVVDLRIEPTVLGHTHNVLAEVGFSQDLPSPEGVAHRYRRGGATIEVLAPDQPGRWVKGQTHRRATRRRGCHFPACSPRSRRGPSVNAAARHRCWGTCSASSSPASSSIVTPRTPRLPAATDFVGNVHVEQHVASVGT